jgi:sensor histidine kinase regulating citrate/malate metabolism
MLTFKNLSHKTKIVILVLLIAAIISAVLIMYLFSQYAPTTEDQSPQPAVNSKQAELQQSIEKISQECHSNFPKSTDEQCYNYAYNRTAVDKKDPSFCQKITDQKQKEKCLRYLDLMLQNKQN